MSLVHNLYLPRSAPFRYANQANQQKYCGVDGTKVPKEQWFHPDKSILPPPLPEDKRAEAKKRMEENRELIEENFKKINDGTSKGCPVVVRSNYILGPKAEEKKPESTLVE
jgi:hypothetical protein